MLDEWQTLTTTDFAGLDPATTVALLPVAAIEQHGPHLPLGTDLIINRGILKKAAERLASATRVLVLPEQMIGDSLEHSAFPGTLTIPTAQLLTQWSAIGRCVAKAGLRKLVIFNSHGGQIGLVDQVALQLRVKFRMFVVRANYFRFGLPDGLFDRDEAANGLHGGEVETALMLYLRPDLVRREALRDFATSAPMPGAMLGPEKPVGYAWMSQDLNPAGAFGNAARADAVRGERLLDYLGARLAKLLDETAAMPLHQAGNRLIAGP